MTLLLGGWYQANAPSPSDVPAPTIRVNTRLVLVDVVVTDKQGKPVPALSRDAFAVEEGGKPQKISVFETPQASQLPQAPALPPGIYSNRAQFRSPGGPIVVLLLDAVNTPFKDQAYARQQMLRFVHEQYKPGQRIAIYTLTDSLRVLQDFTNDPQVLYMALQNYLPEPQRLATANRPETTIASGNPTASSTVTATDASTPSATHGTGDASLRPGGTGTTTQNAIQLFESASVAYQLDQRKVITLDALNAMARTLGGMPGHKSIVWVTADLPFSLIPENNAYSEAQLAEEMPGLGVHKLDQRSSGSQAATSRGSNAEQIRETASRLSNAQVAIYPVDARGLSIATDSDAQEIMRDIASETGGRAYVNQNEIKDGVARAFEDASVTYTVGYYPENRKWDGKYRPIRVKVQRDGLEVRYRRGYYAIDLTQTKGFKPDQEVASTLRDAVPATLVAFTARVVPPSANSAKGKLGIDFLVDASTVSTEDASNGKKLNIAFYAYTFSSAGKILGNRSMKVDQTFDVTTFQQILQKGLLLHMDLDPAPGDARLRLAVQDNRTGMVGSLEAPVPSQ